MAEEDDDVLLANIEEVEESESIAVVPEIDNTQQEGDEVPEKATITDKEFYKAMQKVKDRGTNAVPPKKSASAYILFGKEVSCILMTLYEFFPCMKRYFSLRSYRSIALFIR